MGNLVGGIPALGMPLLRLILSFAYIEGTWDDEIEEKLDAMFGLPLMMDFIKSGQEEVPKSVEMVKLVGLEYELHEWLQAHRTFTPLDEILTHLSKMTIISPSITTLCLY